MDPQLCANHAVCRLGAHAGCPCRVINAASFHQIMPYGLSIPCFEGGQHGFIQTSCQHLSGRRLLESVLRSGKADPGRKTTRLCEFGPGLRHLVLLAVHQAGMTTQCVGRHEPGKAELVQTARQRLPGFQLALE